MKKIVILFLIGLFSFFCFQKANSQKIECDCSILYEISLEKAEGVRFGYINCKGEIVVEPRFLMVSSFIDGIGIVNVENKSLGQNANGSQLFEITDGIVDTKGRLIVLPNIDIISSFSEGFALVKSNNRFAYIDKLGKIAITVPSELKILDDDNSTAEESPFLNGLAVLRAKEEGFYVIDKNGSYKLHKTLDRIKTKKNIEIVEAEGKYALVNKLGNYIFGPQNDRIDESEEIFYTIPEGTNKKHLFFNNKGKRIFEIPADYIGSFSEGLAKIKMGDKSGYINKTGKVIIPTKYDDAGDFSESVAAIKINAKWGFIDNQGKLMIPLKFDYIYESFYCGLAYVQIGDEEGYINKTGNWIWKKNITS